MESLDLAKERVEIRTKNNGHFVLDSTIDFKWKEGYKNLNLFYNQFDYLSFIDNSKRDIPTIMFELTKESENEFNFFMFIDKLPIYAERRFPKIFNLIKKGN